MTASVNGRSVSAVASGALGNEHNVTGEANVGC